MGEFCVHYRMASYLLPLSDGFCALWNVVWEVCKQMRRGWPCFCSMTAIAGSSDNVLASHSKQHLHQLRLGRDLDVV